MGFARAFRFVIWASGAFFVLTIAAMLLYPGGRVADVNSRGYAFFSNFFSDLGQTRTYGGHANLPSMVLFCIALVAIGAGIAVFFSAFARFFTGTRAGRTFSVGATICAVVAGACFWGVAATPWNLYLQAHNDFVQWAFRAFLLAVILSGIACAITPSMRRFVYVFAAFALVLAAYIAILTVGPAAGTPSGALIQATAQKVIVYASMLTICVQAWIALRSAPRAFT